MISIPDSWWRRLLKSEPSKAREDAKWKAQRCAEELDKVDCWADAKVSEGNKCFIVTYTRGYGHETRYTADIFRY